MTRGFSSATQTGQRHKKKLGKTLREHDRAVRVSSVLL